jgi:glycosyltransferase involved in cell wall biosynthesis
LKILFIHNRYQHKGGEDNVLLMEKGVLDTNGHETKVLAFDNEQIGSLGSKIKTAFSAIYNFRSAAQVKKEIMAFRPDIIHVHNIFFTASPSVLVMAHKMKVPVVMTIHNFRLICANALLLRDNHVCELCTQKKFPVHGIKYKCYRSSAVESALVTTITGIHKLLRTWRTKVDTFIFLSNFMKNKFLHSSLEPIEEKTTVKPNFTADVFTANVPRSDFFLFAGRLSKEKGIDILVQTFLRNPSARLVIAGSGPEEANVKAQVKDAPNIQMAGAQERKQLLLLMQQCKALVFPSVWYEGQPLTILEAFSTGTPVIASRLGAMSELIEDGVNGYLFAPGDTNELEKCLNRFAADSPAQNMLYANARQSYIDRFTPNIHYNNIMDIYNKAIKNRAS